MKFKTGFWGFIFGGLTGAAVALLVAPQSGDETRQMLIENSHQMKEDALDAIQEAQESAVAKMNQAQERFDTETKELMDKLQEAGKTKSDGINVYDVNSKKAEETVPA